MSPLQPGHTHHKDISVPIGFVFLSIVDLGATIDCMGRTFYKANGSNGTTNLMDKFPRMTNAPTTTGGADSHTLTVNELPNTWYGVNAGNGWPNPGGAINWTGPGGGQPHENRPAFIELIPYQAVS